MQGNSLFEKTYNHVVFHIDDCDFDKFKERVIAMGVEIKNARKRESGEERSLYFYDFDNHLFEIHAGTLDDRLVAYNQAK